MATGRDGYNWRVFLIENITRVEVEQSGQLLVVHNTSHNVEEGEWLESRSRMI